MFRFFWGLIFMFISVPIQAQQSLDISFSMNDFIIVTNDGISAIVTTLKERRVCGDSISPNLPYFFYRIPLQQGQGNVSVNVSYSDSLLSENISMVPNPKPSIRNGKTLREEINRVATRSVESPLHYSGIKYQNGKGYLMLKITPFLYDVGNRRLRFVKNVHLSFNGIPVKQNVNPVSIHDALSLTSLTQDMSGVPNDRTENDTIDYLIITNSTLASSFNQLAQWKRRKCLRTKIVTLDSIYAQYPQYNDNPSKIKAYILNYASPTRMKWVLLGGDDSVVPAKYCDVPSINSDSFGPFTPSDWYYSCVDDHTNLNWDTNNDGYIGTIEDSIDYTPCVYISRLPVRSSQDVLNYTVKLINYENGLGISNNMLFAGYMVYEILDGKSDSHILLDNIYEEYVNGYWSGDFKKLYDTGSDYQFNISGINLSNVIDTQFNIIHCNSHGDEDRWRSPDSTTFVYDNILASCQTNSPGSVVVTGACLTNAFDFEPCLSETLLRNPSGGAIAYFGSSRPNRGGDCITHYNNDVPILWGDVYDSFFLHYLFTGTPTDGSYSIAAIATEAKTTVYNEHVDDDDDDQPFYHDLLLAINAMGDPEMPVWTDTVHSFTSWNGPSVGPYLIHSMTGGSLDVISPVGGCTIAVLDEHGTRQVVYNTNGATFSGLDGNTYVAIMKHNYKPYLTTTTVHSGGIIGPIIHATQTGEDLTIYIEEPIENNTLDESTSSTGSTSNTWYLTITDLVRGNTKISQLVVGNSYQMSTSDWTFGIYGIQATKDGKIASTKIVIN